jgi:hypothetical protein
VTDSPRCSLCGRLVARLERSYCSERCETVAQSGYVPPQIAEALLRSPSTRLDARVILVTAEGEAPRAGLADDSWIGSPDSGRRLVRLGAETREELEQAVEQLRAATGAEVQVFTVQQFSSDALDRGRNVLNDHGGGK